MRPGFSTNLDHAIRQEDGNRNQLIASQNLWMHNDGMFLKTER